MNIFTPSKLERDCIVVIGKESTGKSQLIASLTGQTAHSANFRGSTVTCDTYQSEAYTFIDTPGILYRSDSVTTKKALRQLQENDTVLLIVKATDVDRDLADLLPLVADKRGIVVITFWDKVFSTAHNGQHAGKCRCSPPHNRTKRIYFGFSARTSSFSLPMDSCKGWLVY